MAPTQQNMPRNSSLYSYSPSARAAAIAAIIMCIVFLFLLVRTIKTRAWVSLVMIFAAAMNGFGLVCRVYSITNPNNIMATVISYMTIILAPSFAAAACYIAFKRLVYFVTPPPSLHQRALWVPPHYITRIFVGFDTSAFLIQFFGLVVLAGAATGNKSPPEIATAVENGERILKLGLIVQLLCFGIFAVIGLRFIIVSRDWHVQNGTEWRPLAWAINTCATIIMLRAIYRVIEFSGAAVGGYIAAHEWTYWVFDAYPMMIVFTLAYFVHPGQYLPQEFLKLRYKGVKLNEEL